MTPPTHVIYHPNQGLIDKKQAAARLGVKQTTLDKLISLGEIGVVRIGRCVRFRPQSIDLFCETRETKISSKRMTVMRGSRK